MGKKATVAEKKQRIRYVYEALLSDYNRADIIQHAAKKWGVQTRMADGYIAEATAIIKQEVEQQQAEGFVKHLARRRFYRNKAIVGNDLRLALEIDRDEAKLLGLYPSDKIEHTWRDNLPEDWDPEEVKKQFVDLMKLSALNNDDQSS